MKGLVGERTRASEIRALRVSKVMGLVCSRTVRPVVGDSGAPRHLVSRTLSAMADADDTGGSRKGRY